MVNKILFRELESSDSDGFTVLSGERALISDLIQWSLGDRTGKIVGLQRDFGQEFTNEGYAYIRFNSTPYTFNSVLHANLFSLLGTNILPAMNNAYFKHSNTSLIAESSKLRLHQEVLNKKVKHLRAEYEERINNRQSVSGNAVQSDNGTTSLGLKNTKNPFEFTDIIRAQAGNPATINNNPSDPARIVLTFSSEGGGTKNKFKECYSVFYILEKI
jgi:hypothetical protein